MTCYSQKSDLLLEETFDDVVHTVEWQAFSAGAKAAEGSLVLDPSSVQENFVTVTSKSRFRHATLEARIEITGSTSRIFYIGFFSRDPWASDTSWIIVDGRYARLQIRRENGGVAQTSPLPVDPGWHTVKIVWSEAKVEYFWNGLPAGSVTDPSDIPDKFLSIAIDATERGDDAGVNLVDWVKVSGGEQEQ